MSACSIPCHRCIKEYDIKGEPSGVEFFDSMPISSKQMILCNLCGNKRCPRASDHRLECTFSNEPGQPGSIYADCSAISGDVKS